jgi:hypothetical protein
VDPTVVTVSCELPVPVIDAGLKVAVAPLGKPEALRFATLEYPFCPAMLMVYVVDPPGGIDWLEGVAASAKSAAALTTSIAEAEWLSVLPDAMTLSG